MITLLMMMMMMMTVTMMDGDEDEDDFADDEDDEDDGDDDDDGTLPMRLTLADKGSADFALICPTTREKRFYRSSDLKQSKVGT